MLPRHLYFLAVPVSSNGAGGRDEGGLFVPSDQSLFYDSEQRPRPAWSAVAGWTSTKLKEGGFLKQGQRQVWLDFAVP